MKKGEIKFCEINRLFDEKIFSEDFFENLCIKTTLKKKGYFFDDFSREKNLGKPIFVKLKKFLEVIKIWRLTPKKKKKSNWIKSKNHIKLIQKKLSDQILKSSSKKKKTNYFQRKKNKKKSLSPNLF